jgi:hypothetical protein
MTNSTSELLDLARAVLEKNAPKMGQCVGQCWDRPLKLLSHACALLGQLFVSKVNNITLLSRCPSP